MLAGQRRGVGRLAELVVLALRESVSNGSRDSGDTK